jgi:drug/metabolite transporter (DMT)-like permease
MKDKLGYIFVLLAAILWGSTAAVGKLLLENLSNLQILPFLTLFAFFGLLIVVFIQKKQRIIKTYNKKDYLTFAWMGFIGVFSYAFFLYGALQLLPAQEAFIINYLWPIMFVVFAVIILKEKMNWRKWLGVFFSFVGVVVVVSRGDFSLIHFNNSLGILSALAGSVAYGLFSVLGKKHDYEKFTSMMFYYLFSFIYAVIAVLLFSKIPHISALQLLGLAWLGIFTSGLAYVFWFLALKHGDTAKMSNIIFITPFLSLVYIYFLVGEKILFSSIVGLVIIIAGILMQSLYNKRNIENKK